MKTGKIISAICMFVVMGGAMNTAHGLAMNAQIRSLLQEKQDKIATLEKCEGNKKGWMIAGISTIGLTAVGVVGNVVLAGKSGNLSEEIAAGKEKLQTNANELERVNNKISDLSASRDGGGNGSLGNGSRGGGNGPLGSGSRDVPGIIGQKCGNNGAGVWFQRADGSDTCLQSKNEVKCQCVRKSCVRDNKLIFSGKVIDESGEIVPFANIKCTSKKGKEFHANGLNVLPDEGGGGSDFYGEFCFDESVPRGAQCEISCVGYNKAVGSIEEMESHKDKLKLCSSTPLSEVFPFETDCKAGSGTGGSGEAGGSGSNNLDPDVEGKDRCYYDIDGDYKYEGGCEVTEPGDWGVDFQDYTVYGKAVCNDNSGTLSQTSSVEQIEKMGKNCWCKMTKPSVPYWIFRHSYDESSECIEYCASSCAYGVSGESDFRKVVFGK